MRRSLALSSLLCCIGCQAGLPSPVPARLSDVPWSGGVGDGAVLGAREAHDRGDSLAALAEVERVLEAEPRHVDAHRLRQDILRERGRVGRVMVEAQERVVEWQRDPRALYLRGRVALTDAAKLRDFRAALDGQHDLFWGWLGLAFVLRGSRPDEALAIYAGMYEATGGHPLVAVALGAALRAMQRYPQALQVYDALRSGSLTPGVGELGMAETYLAAEKRGEAWAPLMAALRLRPYDPGVQRLIEFYLSQGLPDQQVEQIVSVLWERPEERMAAFKQSSGAALLAALLERLGLYPGAREALQGGDGPATSAVRRHLRRVRLSAGDVRGYLNDLNDSFPDLLLRDERNQVRGLWVRALRGPWAEIDDPLADPQRGVGLASALRDCGLLLEADLVAALTLERHPDLPGIDRAEAQELRADVRRELAFEGALGRLIYRGYAAEGEAADRSLAELLEQIRKLSLEIFGRDVVGQPQMFNVPLVGELVDPFGPGLSQHLARYNKHLVLGQRNSSPAEGLLFTRLSTRYLEPSAELPLPSRCWQVVGGHRQIQSLQGVLGGDLAGIALLNHYVIDMDAVHDWAATLSERRRIVRTDGDALLQDPVPRRVDPLQPVDVHWRLAAMSPVADDALEAAVFDMICWHERAHLRDSFHFLPPEQNLWRVLGLMFEHGFSAFAVEAEMEGRAETASLAFSPHTDLVLAHIAGFLETVSESSPHAEGFRTLARRVNAALAKDPSQAANAAVSRWHLVPGETMRRIGASLLPGH